MLSISLKLKQWKTNRKSMEMLGFPPKCSFLVVLVVSIFVTLRRPQCSPGMGVSMVSPLNIARERVIVGPNSVVGVVFARERSYVSEKKSLEINENL